MPFLSPVVALAAADRVRARLARRRPALPERRLVITLENVRKEFVVRERAGACPTQTAGRRGRRRDRPAGGEGRDARLPRAERRRQVDHRQDADRDPRPDVGAGHRRRARALAAAGRARAADRRDVRSAGPALVGSPARRVVRAAAARLPRPGRPPPRRTSPPSASCSTSTRSCRHARAAAVARPAHPWRARPPRCSTTRRSCSSTSRRSVST